MIGTLVNSITILGGGLLGLAVGARFDQKYQDSVVSALGLAVVVLGLQMAFKSNNYLIVICSMALGALIGAWIDIEKQLETVGEKFKKGLKSNNSKLVEGFVTATLIYCIGSMGILGAIKDGMDGDPSILYAKALLDGIISIALASTLGIGVILSCIPVLIYQGVIALAAMNFGSFVSEPALDNMTATGGLLIAGIGLNLLGFTKLKMGNYLPAVIFAIVLSIIFSKS